jgi:hypothetical protein
MRRASSKEASRRRLYSYKYDDDDRRPASMVPFQDFTAVQKLQVLALSTPQPPLTHLSGRSSKW